MQIGHFAVDGRKVDFEVAGAHHRAHRAGDGQGKGAGDGVGHLDEAHGEAAQLDHLPGHHGIEGDAVDPVLLELVFDERHGEAAAVKRRGHLGRHIGNGADVILVAVGEHIAPYPVPVGHQIAGVRDHQVDAQHVVLGEHGPAVHHNDILIVLEHRDVLAEFVNAAQGNDS